MNPDPVSNTDLFGVLPKPIAAFVAVVLLCGPMISEIKGWTNGPLAKRMSRTTEKLAAEKDAAAKKDAADQRSADDGWHARDRRVDELEAAMQLMSQRIDSQRTELNTLHLLGDAQNRLLANHGAWDRQAQAVINQLGGDLPPPPPLYVYPEETQ